MKKRSENHYKKAGTVLFLLVMMAGMVIALIMPLRPTVSNVEKRTLTTFPTDITLESFLDGSWCSDVSTWYSDTFPGREQLLLMVSRLKEYYGINTDTVIGNIEKGDDIPEAGETVAPVTAAPTTAATTEAVTEDAGTEEETDATTAEETTQAETEKEIRSGDERTVTGETVGTLYIEGDTAYELFYFNREATDDYITALNTLAANLDPSVDIYCLLAPTASEIMLPRSFLDTMDSASEEKAFAYIFGALDSRIEPVEVTWTLREHENEYIYFRTDHHWTALGAYYAYCVFMEQKGWNPVSLADFESITFSGFLGSFYSGSNQNSALASNPDSIVAYYPKSTNKITLTDYDEVSTFDWQVVHNVGNNSKYNMYACFIGGDYPIAHIDNPNTTDGTNCLIIKDSYANAMVPFLVDHYDNIWLVDSRYYTGDLYQLIEDNDISEVIIINNAETAASSLVLMPDLQSMLTPK